MQINPIKLGPFITAVCSLLAFTYSATAAITGSVHDFSTYSWSGGEICVLCHSPHGGAAVDAPLWNHEISTATYTLYSSPSLAQTPQPQGPGDMSRLCLSCHDGTVAIDSFGGTTGTTYIQTINPNVLIGTDLSNDHPVGIMWDHQEPHKACGACHTFPQTIKFVFRNGRGYVECSTCHDVHNNGANPKLLRLPMSGSQLCLTCHQI